MTTITDTFNRANVTPLGTTSDGTATWTQDNGNWGVVTNRANNVSGIQPNKAWINTGSGDGTVQVTVAGIDAGTSGNVFTGLMFRRSDTTHYWTVVTRGGANAGQVRQVNGTPGISASGFSLVAGDIVTVVLAGSSITVKVNGTTVATLTDSFNSTATTHGIYGDTSAAFLDDWSFTPAPPTAWHRPNIVVRPRAVTRAAVV